MECLSEVTVVDWMHGALPVGQQARADAHLASCADCLTLVAVLGRSSEPRGAEPIDEQGRYRLREEIAVGGMGRVLAAQDTVLDREVAVKVVRDPDARGLCARLRREMAITARLQHPAIVPIYDAGTTIAGDPFFAMRRVLGSSLEQLARECPSLDRRLELLGATMRAAEAIAYANDQKVLHRDLKPHNILVGPHGETVVVDWGLALDLGAAKDPRRTSPNPSEPAELATTLAHDGAPGSNGDALTAAGQIVGTPGYMAPEQARGEALDARADVYGLGGILYFLATGKAPHEGDDGKHSRQVIPARARCATIPIELEAIIERALAETPDDRYASAAELAQDLRRFQAGLLVSAHEYSAWQLFGRWLRRHRLPVAVAAIAAVTILAIGVYAFQRTLSAKAIAEGERSRAQKQRLEAERVIEFTLTDLRARLESYGKLELLQDVGAQVERYYRQTPPRPGVDGAADLRRQANTLALLGDVKRALNQNQEADDLYQQSLVIAERALQWEASDASHQAIAFVLLRQADQAQRRGDLSGARMLFDRVIRLSTERVDDHEQWLEIAAHGYFSQAAVARQVGDSHEAMRLLELGRPYAERASKSTWTGTTNRRRMLTMLLDQQGTIAAEAGDAAKAHEYFEENLSLLLKLEAAPEDADYQQELATVYFAAARGRSMVGDDVGAGAAIDKALEITQGILQREPAHRDWNTLAANLRSFQGHLASDRGDHESALQAFRDSKARNVAAFGPTPSEADLRSLLVADDTNIGMALMELGQLAEAAPHYYTALEGVNKLCAELPDVDEFASNRLVILEHLGHLELRRRNRAAARRANQEVVAAREQRLAKDDTPENRMWLANSLLSAYAINGDSAVLDRAQEVLAPLGAREDNAMLKNLLEELEAARGKRRAANR